MTSVNRSVQSKSSNNELLESLNIVSVILRSPAQFFDEVRDSMDLPTKILALLASSLIFLTIYGALLGSGHPLQAISSAIKLPFVFLGGLAACIPTLYIFDVLLGSKRSLAQTVVILLTAVTVIATLLFSFVPITVVFRLTANGYQFFKLLNVGFLAIAMVAGSIYLKQGLKRTTSLKRRGGLLKQDSEKEDKSILRYWLYILWIVIFLVVISQLAWALRPFFHFPGAPFTLFVGGGNLFTDVDGAIGEFLGFWLVRNW